MGSLDYVNLGAFAPQRGLPQPSLLDYFGQGQQAVQSTLDAQFQADSRHRLLEQQDQQLANERLFGPVQLDTAKASLNNTNLHNAALAASLGPLPNLDGPGDYSGIGPATLPGPASAGSSNPTAGRNNGSTGSAVPLIPPGQGITDNDLPQYPSGPGPASLFAAKSTGYHPVSPDDPDSKMEGGSLDAQGNKINTLDAYRRGEAPYVTAAIDRSSPLFGTTAFSPDLGAPIHFSDTGPAFQGKGTSRVDIARDTSAGANSDENNGLLHFTLGNPALNGPGDATAFWVSNVAPSAVTPRPTPPVPTHPVPSGYSGPIFGEDTPGPGSATVPASLSMGPGMLDTGYFADPVNKQGWTHVDPADRHLVPAGATFGTHRVTKANPNIAAQDKNLMAQATKAGLDLSDYNVDANGLFTADARGSLQSDLAEAKQHGGQVVPARLKVTASQMGIPIVGKTVDDITQAIQDKQINDGIIPPNLQPVAERFQQQVLAHPALKHFAQIREAKEAIDAAAANPDAGGFADMAAVEGFQRMVNPGAVVRQGTIQNMRDAAGYLQQFSPTFQFEKAVQGDKFSPAARQRLQGLASDIYQRYMAGVAPAVEGMKRQAHGYNLPPAFVDNVLQTTPVVDAGGGLDSIPAASVDGGATGNQMKLTGTEAVTPTGTRADPVAIINQAAYDALTSGAFYTDSTGRLHQKK